MIPNELRKIPQWILWKYYERDGKRTKMPVDSATGLPFTKGDAWDKSSNWLTYKTAAKILENDPSFDGLGLVLTSNYRLFAIDLDSDFPDKEAVIAAIDSYTEVSPSGKGVRIFAFGSLEDIHKNNRELHCEIYSHRKWVSVTGASTGQSAIVQRRTSKLRSFIAEYFPTETPTVETLVSGKLPQAVSAILERDDNFARKWHGHHSDLGFPSPSEQRISIIESLMLRRVSLNNIVHAMQIWRPDERWNNLNWRMRELNAASEHWQANVPQEKAIKLWTVEELAGVPAPAYLIDKYLCENSLAVLFGQAGLKKSFLAVDWALSIGTGSDWFRWSVPSPQPVVYAAAEGFPGMYKRVRAWCLHRLHSEPKNVPVRFVENAVHLADPRHAEHFLEAVRDFRPKLLILDTMNWFFGDLDENFASDMKLFLEACKQFQTDLRCCVLLITHPSKAVPDSERGSSVLAGAAQTRIHITPYYSRLRRSAETDTASLVPGKCQVGVVKQKDDAVPNRLPLRAELVWDARSLVLVPEPEPEDQLLWAVYDIVKGNPGCSETFIRRALGGGEKANHATVKNALGYWHSQQEIEQRDGNYFCSA